MLRTFPSVILQIRPPLRLAVFLRFFVGALLFVSYGLSAPPALGDERSLMVATTPPLELNGINRPLHVVLMINEPLNDFWRLSKQAAQQAAKELNIVLNVIELNNNPLYPIRALSALVNSSQKPDAVLFSNMKNTGKAVLDLLEKHHIHSIIYDNGFSPKEGIGQPGERYNYWLGQITVNNYNASQRLTYELIEKALDLYPDQQPISMIALDGDAISQTNAQRLLGMFDALVDQSGRVDLKQIFNTRYNPKHAYNALLIAKQRYPELRLIWAANDDMALAAIEAAKSIGLEPGKDILIIGFDLTPKAQAGIKQGELFNSYGGHYLAASWALVYLKDVMEGVTPRYRTLHIPLFSGLGELKDRDQQLQRDFRFSELMFKSFSKAPNQTHYRFESPNLP
ncbi:ABC transporter substrate-binding protein [Oceanospirillum maris]|uniref:ABC transporter substrate-binding protein n=1 Tax=Oceanospirillum maris TaxID=64977 RepID=UPI000A02599C|nr:ABC transporter substrate-binding protein [Oceanospirillum maris]